MNPLELIQQKFDTFTKTEQTIAVYILNNPNMFARQPIECTVETTGTSKPAMIRFAKKLGYNGYSEMRFDFSRFLVSTSYSNPETPVSDDQAIRFITKQYIDFIDQINQTLTTQQVHDLSKRIINAPKTKILALNRTALSAYQLQMRALKIGLDLDVIEDRVMMYDIAEYLSPNDLCIIFTVRDNSKLYGRLVETMTSKDVDVVAVTMTPSLEWIKKCAQVITLPQVFKGYAKFIDEQAIIFVFVEILLHELAKMMQRENNENA